MDIFDIIIEPPSSTMELVFDINFISLTIIAITLLITLFIMTYYRRFISICTLNYIITLLKQEKITYKHFAFLVARILCYRHKTTQISKENPPFKSSKDKHYLWIGLVDILNDVRYGKETSPVQSYTKLYKTTIEWLRHS